MQALLAEYGLHPRERPPMEYMDALTRSLELTPRSRLLRERASAPRRCVSARSSRGDIPALPGLPPPVRTWPELTQPRPCSAVTPRSPRVNCTAGSSALGMHQPRPASASFLAALDHQPDSARAKQGFRQATEMFKVDEPQRWGNWPFEPRQPPPPPSPWRRKKVKKKKKVPLVPPRQVGSPSTSDVTPRSLEFCWPAVPTSGEDDPARRDDEVLGYELEMSEICLIDGAKPWAQVVSSK